jgi:hypothetical protein
MALGVLSLVTHQSVACGWSRPLYARIVENDAWAQLDLDMYETYWSPFDARFGFRPGVDPSTWPAIREPSPSVTIDLSSIFEHDGPRFAAGARAVDALGLYALTCVTEVGDELLVLDWQHPCYRFSPHRQSLNDGAWPVHIFPNGDYYAFLNYDLSMGTFGHPWEQTLCIFGEPLIERLGEPLAVMLGAKRRR